MVATASIRRELAARGFKALLRQGGAVGTTQTGDERSGFSTASTRASQLAAIAACPS
jgi:hypothetical protein